MNPPKVRQITLNQYSSNCLRFIELVLHGPSILCLIFILCKFKDASKLFYKLFCLYTLVYADACNNTAGYSSTNRLPCLLHSCFTLDSIACFLRYLVTLQINAMETVIYTSNTIVLVQVKLIPLSPQIPLETLINIQLQVRQYNYQYNYKQLLASSAYSYCLLPPLRPTAVRPSTHSPHPSATLTPTDEPSSSSCWPTQPCSPLQLAATYLLE